MVTKVLKEASDIEGLSRFIAARGKFPMTVTITQGAPRSDLQNRLAQLAVQSQCFVVTEGAVNGGDACG